MRNDQPPSESLLNMIIRAAITEQAKQAKDARAPGKKTPDDMVDRRDEKGTPYPGDFPNPLGDNRDGCF